MHISHADWIQHLLRKQHESIKLTLQKKKKKKHYHEAQVRERVVCD